MKLTSILCLSFALLAGHNAVADCGSTASEAVATCLGQELRNSDAYINTIYQKAMTALNEGEQKALRTEQRKWLKERNAICQLDTKETDRELWYQGVLTDYNKTVCVTRYTRVRTSELFQVWVAKLQSNGSGQGVSANTAGPTETATPQSRPDLFPKSPHAYWVASSHAWSKGRWYWESTVKSDDIARFHATTLSIGCSRAEGGGAGLLVDIRPGDVSTQRGTVVYGIAIDLDEGKIYSRQNGTWTNGEPGSSKGVDVKLGKIYTCGVNSTIAVKPLQSRNYLQTNFGDKPFVYSLPDGYRPFGAP